MTVYQRVPLSDCHQWPADRNCDLRIALAVGSNIEPKCRSCRFRFARPCHKKETIVQQKVWTRASCVNCFPAIPEFCQLEVHSCPFLLDDCLWKARSSLLLGRVQFVELAGVSPILTSLQHRVPSRFHPQMSTKSSRCVGMPKGENLPFRYGSIAINTIFRGMNIHLPAILMWTTGVQGFDPSPFKSKWYHPRTNSAGANGDWDPPTKDRWLPLTSQRKKQAAGCGEFATLFVLQDGTPQWCQLVYNPQWKLIRYIYHKP